MTADEEPHLHEVVLPDVATELFLAYLEHLVCSTKSSFSAPGPPRA